jgi:hypothetical protein
MTLVDQILDIDQNLEIEVRKKAKCYITLSLYGQYMFILQCGECQNWKHGLQFLD